MPVTYFVDKMRVTRPTGKTAERHPERVYTINGVFYSTTIDPDGDLVVKDRLSIISKNVDRSDIMSVEFSIDLAGKTLTLPEGKRGRMAQSGLSEADILADLASLRGEDIIDDANIDDVEPTASTTRTKSK